MDLGQLQEEHAQWLIHNFPAQQGHEPLLGAMEELGELAHTHLKYDQNIRGYTLDLYREKAADAVGDIVIYLASYCTANGFSLDDCVTWTWETVKSRDWIAFPANGRTS
jgi:NTP pyrophosphatase (non-canonical NTP hydrolase)